MRRFNPRPKLLTASTEPQEHALPLCYCTDRGDGSSYSSYVSVDFGPVRENLPFGGLWLWRMVLVLFAAKKLLFLLPPSPSFPAGYRRTKLGPTTASAHVLPRHPPSFAFSSMFTNYFHSGTLYSLRLKLGHPDLNPHHIIPMRSVWAH